MKALGFKIDPTRKSVSPSGRRRRKRRKRKRRTLGQGPENEDPRPSSQRLMTKPHLLIVIKTWFKVYSILPIDRLGHIEPKGPTARGYLETLHPPSVDRIKP